MMVTVGTYPFDRVCDFFESSNIETLDEHVYFGTTPAIFSTIVGAESVGKTFNELVVKGKFNYEKVNRNAS